MSANNSKTVKIIHIFSFLIFTAAFIVLLCLNLFDKNFCTITGLVFLWLGLITFVIALTYKKEGSYIPPFVLIFAGIAFFFEVFSINTPFGLLSLRLMYPLIFLGAGLGGLVVQKNGAPVSKFYYIFNFGLYVLLTILMLLLSR